MNSSHFNFVDLRVSLYIYVRACVCVYSSVSPRRTWKCSSVNPPLDKKKKADGVVKAVFFFFYTGHGCCKLKTLRTSTRSWKSVFYCDSGNKTVVDLASGFKVAFLVLSLRQI